MNPLPRLNWLPVPGFETSCTFADLGDYLNGDGVRFHVQFMPTCYRRGPYRLLIEVASGPGHNLWGCFDEQDSPLRWYHKLETLRAESEEIARVLWHDRHETPLPAPPANEAPLTAWWYANELKAQIEEELFKGLTPEHDDANQSHLDFLTTCRNTLTGHAREAAELLLTRHEIIARRLRAQTPKDA